MYSQYREEEFILQAFDPTHIGRFLDIGAWNAKKFSNTRALYERGWSGIMVEPSPLPMQNLLMEYGAEPRITLINAAVGPNNHMVRLRVSEDALSTTSEEQYERWHKEGGYYGSMFVPTITLADIFLQFGGRFEFISIDTEGSSAELLKALLATEARPHCICFEHDRRFAESFAHFDQAGYRLVHENDTNRVLVRK